MAYVYMVTDGANKKTYVGYTVKPERRIRQHNGELVNGARTTSRFVGGVKFVMLAGPFASKRVALSVEACWKRSRPRWRGILGRARKFKLLMERPRSYWKFNDDYKITIFDPCLSEIFPDAEHDYS